MFYSQFLLSKNGALGIIWMAAHCHKRLKKDQVQQTNIPSSVDKILDDEVPIVTHRILAFLLLSIVRIYSKKVEYLFHDCHEVLNRLCSSKTGRRVRRERLEVPLRHYQSITLPKRFELDTYDLGVDQDATSGKVRSHEQDIRDDGHRKGRSRSGSFLKDMVPMSRPNSTADTPPRDVFGAPHVEQDFVKISSNTNISLTGVEVLRRALCSRQDCVGPVQLDESAKASENEELNDRHTSGNASPSFSGRIQEQMHDNLSDKDLITNYRGVCNEVESDIVVRTSSLEILQGIEFALEDRLDPMVLDEAEKEQLYDRPSDKSASSNGQGSIHDVEFNSAVNEFPKGSDPVKSVGSQGFTEAANKLESVQCQKPDKFFLVDVLDPHSKISDAGISEVAAVQTPGRKERARILKKRKAPLMPLIDEAPVIPNKVLKSWIVEDPIDLRRGTKKVPHSLLQVWKAEKLRHLPHNILDPLVPGIPVNLTYLGCGESCAPEIKSAALSSDQAPAPHVAEEQIPSVAEKPSKLTPDIASLEQALADRSPVAEDSLEQIPIAPGTPIAHLNSSRFHEAATGADLDIMEPSFLTENIENLDALFQEGTSSHGGDSLQKGKSIYSARTRMTGSYLAKRFMHKRRRKEEEVLNLTRLLAGKTKREGAIMFHEILVLKTLDCIDVQQETAYCDILLHETPKLRQYFK